MKFSWVVLCPTQLTRSCRRGKMVRLFTIRQARCPAYGGWWHLYGVSIAAGFLIALLAQLLNLYLPKSFASSRTHLPSDCNGDFLPIEISCLE